MFKNRRWLVLALCVGAIAQTACISAAGTEATAGLQVVATHSILGDLVTNVGGDAIDLQTLVGPNGDAHTYEAKPSDLVTIKEADLFFVNGLGFEPWMEELYRSSESAAKLVVATHNVEALPFEDKEHEDDQEEGEEHGELDPHVWHDVGRVIQMVEVIRDELVEADPDHADTYHANAEAYLDELKALDSWVREQVATLPVDRRRLVTSHDTFRYFAEAYGFDVVGAAMGITTEGAEPSAGEMVDLVDTIRSAGVPVIFAENISNPRLVQQLADEADVEVGPPLYTDALGAPGTEGDTYLTMIRYNVTTIVMALK